MVFKTLKQESFFLHQVLNPYLLHEMEVRYALHYQVFDKKILELIFSLETILLFTSFSLNEQKY